MGSKNEILAELMKEAIMVKSFSTQTQVQVAGVKDGAIDKSIEIVRRELEDDMFLEEIKKISTIVSPLPYSPFSIEYLLSDTADLLKSCMQKRTELKNLETTMLSDCVNKIMTKRRREYERRIQEAESLYPDSVKTINKQTRLETNAGIVEAEEESLKKLTEFEDAVKKAKNDFKKENEKYEDVLLGFSLDKNSGLNYTARYVELKEIYWEDFKEVARKLRCLEIGFKTVYDIDTALPPVSNDNLLNKYYIWLKNNLLKLNKILEREQEISIVVSIMRGNVVTPDTNETKASCVYVQDKSGNLKEAKDIDWIDHLEKGELKFSIKRNQISTDPFYLKKFKIKSFKIVARTISSENWNILVKPPQNKDSLGNIYEKPFLSFVVGATYENAVEHECKNSIYLNSDPFDELWEMKLAKEGFLGNPIIQRRQPPMYPGVEPAKTSIMDIILFLRVSVIS